MFLETLKRLRIGDAVGQFVARGREQTGKDFGDNGPQDRHVRADNGEFGLQDCPEHSHLDRVRDVSEVDGH